MFIDMAIDRPADEGQDARGRAEELAGRRLAEQTKAPK
jgi:hypothetical protein